MQGETRSLFAYVWELENLLNNTTYDLWLSCSAFYKIKRLLYHQDYPPAEFTPDFKPEDFYGPDERFQILAELFGISLEKTKHIAIEPPFHCDYGTNIEFKGDFYSNFNLIVSLFVGASTASWYMT